MSSCRHKQKMIGLITSHILFELILKFKRNGSLAVSTYRLINVKLIQNRNQTRNILSSYFRLLCPMGIWNLLQNAETRGEWINFNVLIDQLTTNWFKTGIRLGISSHLTSALLWPMGIWNLLLRQGGSQIHLTI